MKKHFIAGLVMVAFITAAAALLLVTNSHRAGNDPAQVRALNARIEQLEQKTAALQKELNDLQHRPQTPLVLPDRGLIPPSVASSLPALKMPPGSKPFDFNGLTYYFMPLQHAPQASQ